MSIPSVAGRVCLVSFVWTSGHLYVDVRHNNHSIFWISYECLIWHGVPWHGVPVHTRLTVLSFCGISWMACYPEALSFGKSCGGSWKFIGEGISSWAQKWHTYHTLCQPAGFYGAVLRCKSGAVADSINICPTCQSKHPGKARNEKVKRSSCYGSLGQESCQSSFQPGQITDSCTAISLNTKYTYIIY